ncbi:MAG TPA: hypothetical protein VET23_11410, partial [Chitinophagaceae bacterium]|nr:hypothetical protein [Chitinophagaceae bacterium]
DNGKEEMDLIHYAMVGGMPVSELPDEHIDHFNKWFEDLPSEIKACYHEPNLQNVLDTHTNKLYEQASVYYNEKTGKNISVEDTKAIIKTAFICLTKIDQSRAVRNRMTLKEITDILGKPGTGSKEVGAVLNIFREPGNTFIRPFISEDSSNQDLNEDDVLDITHESLIRNWEYLGQWAKKEFDNYTISLDFEQQLNRWVESGKSKGFLLSIGQLTYFENWFNASKPNAHWIARYLPEEIEEEKKLSKANQVLNNANEFLARSAGKHVVTRTIMRYGPKRIAALVILIGAIILGSFALRNYFLRQNNSVLKSIKEQTFEIAAKPKLSMEFSVPVITQELILGNLTIPEVIDAIKDTAQKIKIATGIATQLVTQGRVEPRKEIVQSLSIADSLLEQLSRPGNSQQFSKELGLIHDFSVTAGFAYLFDQDDTLKSFVTRNAKRSAKWAMQIFKEQPEGFTDIQHLSLALENGINNKIFSPEEINQLLKILSPFENESRTPWVEKEYKRDILLVRGSLNYGIKFNGLYQDLAYLYAAIGKPDKVLKCMDTLLRYQESFYQKDYATKVDKAANIAAVFYTYETTGFLDEFVKGYCERKNIGTVEFYNRLVSRSIFQLFAATFTNFFTGPGSQTFVNLNLEFSSDQMLSYFFTKLKEEILKIKDPGEQNFNMAVILKNEGIVFSSRKESLGISETGTDQLFQDAIKYYQQVPEEYLKQPVSIITSGGSDLITMPRKFLFLYPDYRVPFHPFEPRSLMQFYYSPGFIQYLLDHNLFDAIYTSADEFRYFEMWFLDYHFVRFFKNFFIQVQMKNNIMAHLATKLEERNAKNSAHLNLLYLHLS